MRQGFRPVLSGRGRTLAAGALAGALVVGCSPSAPVPTPTAVPTTSTPTPDPEPTEELPQEPVAPVPSTGTPDERDAEAAAEYFVELYQYALATGDATTWVERSLDDCGFCESTANDVREYKEEGIRYQGGLIDMESARFVDFDETFRIFAVEVPYAVAPAELVNARGDVVRSLEGGTGHLLLEVGYSADSGWMLQTGSAREGSVL